MVSTSHGEKKVDLLHLSAACISSAVIAADQITALASSDTVDSEGIQENKKNARLKIDGSFVTDADMAAQQIIVDALHKVSSGIRIVGEENEEEMRKRAITGHEGRLETISRLALKEILIRYDREQQGSSRDSNDTVLPLAQEQKIDGESTKSEQYEDEQGNQSTSPRTGEMEEFQVDTERVSVFIDPLDATNSYAKGDHAPVSILVAIILDQKPCFGVICKPFGHPQQTSVLDTGCMTVYGGTLLGGAYMAGGAAIVRKKAEKEDLTHEMDRDRNDLPRAVISKSRSKGIVQDFVSHLGERGIIHPEPLLVSGAGEKSLRIITGFHNEGLWFYPKAGTSLWDVAASDALLRATGGRLTDKDGNDMDYTKSRIEAENKNGVIACYDEGLHAECMRIFLEGTWEQKS